MAYRRISLQVGGLVAFTVLILVFASKSVVGQSYFQQRFGNGLRLNFTQLELLGKKSIILGGSTTRSTTYRSTFTFLDSLSTVVWSKEVNLGTFKNVIQDIISINDSTFVISAIVPDTVYPNATSVLLLSLNSNGDTLWTRAYKDSSGSLGFSKFKLQDDTLYAIAGYFRQDSQTGRPLSGSTGWAAISPVNGEIYYLNLFNYPGFTFTFSIDFIIHPVDSLVYIFGNSILTNDTMFNESDFVAKFGRDGHFIKGIQFPNTPSVSYNGGIDLNTSDGSMIVNRDPSGQDCSVMKIDTGLNVSWSKILGFNPCLDIFLIDNEILITDGWFFHYYDTAGVFTHSNLIVDLASNGVISHNVSELVQFDSILFTLGLINISSTLNYPLISCTASNGEGCNLYTQDRTSVNYLINTAPLSLVTMDYQPLDAYFQVQLVDTIITDTMICRTITALVENYPSDVVNLDGAVYPNPSSGSLSIMGLNENSAEWIEILDYQGRRVDFTPMVSGSLDYSYLEPGFYIVRYCVNGLIFSVRWIKL